MSTHDFLLTCRCLPLVVRVRFGLWRAPVTSCARQWEADASRALGRARRGGALELEASDVWRRAHAVKRAARFVPRASCLTQALALQTVLARDGEACALVLGVDGAPDALKPFEAHAWVEWRGRVIIGGPIGRWKPLLTVAPTASQQSPGGAAP